MRGSRSKESIREMRLLLTKRIRDRLGLSNRIGELNLIGLSIRTNRGLL